MILHIFPFFSHTFPITIDRVEDKQVVVEWKDGSLTSIPTYLFPMEVYEGQSWFLHIKKRKEHHTTSPPLTMIQDVELAHVVSNYPAYLYQHNAIISLPHPTVLSLGSVYQIYFSQMRGTYVQ